MGLLKLGRFESAEAVLMDVLEHARELEDERLELAARVELTFLRTVVTAPRPATSSSRPPLQRPSRLEALGAPLERGRALIRACIAQVWRQRLESVARTGREALREVRRAGGSRREETEILEWLSLAHAFGPDPIEEDDLVVREVVERSAEDQSVEWYALLFFAIARTYRGEFDEARELAERSKRITAELGLLVNHACTSLQLTFIELSAGDLVNAERDLRRAHAELQRMGAENPLASVSANLALVLSRRGDVHEVFAHIDDAERVPADDLEPRILAGAARAWALATAGRLADAEDASRAALALWEGSDNVFLGAQALAALAHVLQLRGKSEEARATLARELAMHERKRDLPGAERARRALAAL